MSTNDHFEEVKEIARQASVDIKSAECERSKKRAAEAKSKRLAAKTEKQKANVKEVQDIVRKTSVDNKSAECERSKKRAAEAKSKRLQAKAQKKQEANGTLPIVEKHVCWQACPIVTLPLTRTV